MYNMCKFKVVSVRSCFGKPYRIMLSRIQMIMVISDYEGLVLIVLVDMKEGGGGGNFFV